MVVVGMAADIGTGSRIMSVSPAAVLLGYSCGNIRRVQTKSAVSLRFAAGDYARH